MHPTITCKLKFSEKKIFQDSFIPKIMILPFWAKHLRMTGKSIQFAAKALFMNRQKNLMIFNLTIFPSNLKKKKKKHKWNLCVF